MAYFNLDCKMMMMMMMMKTNKRQCPFNSVQIKIHESRNKSDYGGKHLWKRWVLSANSSNIYGIRKIKCQVRKVHILMPRCRSLIFWRNFRAWPAYIMLVSTKNRPISSVNSAPWCTGRREEGEILVYARSRQTASTTSLSFHSSSQLSELYRQASATAAQADWAASIMVKW